MQNKDINIFLIKVLYLTAYVIVVTQVLALYSIASILFTLTFFVVAILWFQLARKGFTWQDTVVVLTAVASLAVVVINGIINKSALSFSYFRKLIMFLTTLLYFCTADKCNVTKELEKYIFHLNTVIAIFMIVFYLLNKDFMYLYYGRISVYLTFRFTNPNLTAMFLFCIGMIEFAQFYRKRDTKFRYIHLLLVLAMILFILETQSRNCLLALALVAVLGVIIPMKKRSVVSKGWFAFLVVSFPLLFVIVYLQVLDKTWFHKFFGFLVSEGKELDTRFIIWDYSLDWFKESPILGAYSEISRGTGQSQLHNTHVDILCSYGLIVFVLVCYFLWLVLVGRKIDNKYSNMLTTCFVGALFLGTGEAALFSGGLGIYIFAGTFILLRNCDEENVDQLLPNLMEKSHEGIAYKSYGVK